MDDLSVFDLGADGFSFSFIAAAFFSFASALLLSSFHSILTEAWSCPWLCVLERRTKERE